MTDQNSSPADTAFATFVQEHYEQLAADIRAHLLHHIPRYGVLPEAQVTGMIGNSIRLYVESTIARSSQPIMEWLNSMLNERSIQRISLEWIINENIAYRMAMMKIGLPAVAAGLPIAEHLYRYQQYLDDSLTLAVNLYHNQLQLFRTIAHNAPDGIGVADLTGAITYVNPSFQAQLGYGDELGSMQVRDLFGPQDPTIVQDMRTAVFEGSGHWNGNLVYKRKNDSTFIGNVSSYLLRDGQGKPLASVGIVRDISAEIAAEEERLILQEQVIAAQRAALAELSTPIIPINDKVMVMPLVGSIDSSRAGQIMERLLEGLSEAHANTAIIDITGVPVVDTQVAQALLRAAQAAGLVGARVVLTGIRPEVAQTLVGLGVDMSAIVTRSTLQSGIAFALSKL